VILGIAVNYSLHFLAHLKHTPDIKTVIKDLVWPLTIGSTTTVLAFFCLRFANAAVLRDVGLFAGFSLIGAALCALIFLPHLIPANLFQSDHAKPGWLERLSTIVCSGQQPSGLVYSHCYARVFLFCPTGQLQQRLWAN
jgi:predicted exporter